MTIAAFKPDIWSAQLVNDIHLNSVFLDRGLVDTSFSDQTDGTKKVKVPYGNEFGTAQLQNNTGAANLALDKTLLGLNLELDPNDNQKFFGFEVDDITMAQEKPEIISYYLRQTRVEIVKAINEDIVGAMEAGIRSLSTAPTTLTNFNATNATAKLLVELGKAKKTLQNGGYSRDYAMVTNPTHAELIGLNGIANEYYNYIPKPYIGAEVIEDHTVVSKNNWPTKGDTRLMPVYIMPRGTIFMVIKNVQIETQRKEKGFGTIVKGKVSWSNAHALPGAVQGAFYPEVPVV